MKTKAVRWQKNGKAQDKIYEKKTNKTIPGINETRSEKIKLKICIQTCPMRIDPK